MEAATAVKPTVLVVDDEKLIRWTLRERLSAAGFEVLEAEDGLDALDVLASHRVELVVADLAMPGLDGLGLLSRLKQSDPSCPVILMSAFGTPEDSETATRLGAVRFVAKPFDVEELVRLSERSARSVAS